MQVSEPAEVAKPLAMEPMTASQAGDTGKNSPTNLSAGQQEDEGISGHLTQTSLDKCRGSTSQRRSLPEVPSESQPEFSAEKSAEALRMEGVKYLQPLQEFTNALDSPLPVSHPSACVHVCQEQEELEAGASRSRLVQTVPVPSLRCCSFSPSPSFSPM